MKAATTPTWPGSPPPSPFRVHPTISPPSRICRPGASLILTLNRELQSATEKIIDKAVKNTGSLSGTVIVMDPRTGEILAMASTPRIDPNQYWLVNERIAG